MIDNFCKPCHIALVVIVLIAAGHAYLFFTNQDIEKLAWTWPLLAGLQAKYLTGDSQSGGDDEAV